MKTAKSPKSNTTIYTVTAAI